ncbi:ComGF family competence protein [Mesobacillus maritimus]|uniref:competence type IV pilus minor pilin ComGF n=1 Tax=Mesobacillus maritimus TaxID=1643336 RepID=UPI00203B1F3F|nr:competence type IV pilus minor pilin ComGF [Mesobacillus maritimus]MCM3586353.1 ComGF family competence protein [Mesobacillus maritimus]
MVIFAKSKQNACLQNEKGFTLAEMLISFMVFCMLMSFFPPAMKLLLNFNSIDQSIQRLEWEVFHSQVKKEVRSASIITVERDKVLLQLNNDTILYEKYGSNLRRRVNFAGHEILLQNVKTVNFEKVAKGFQIHIQDVHNTTYSGTVWSYVQME